MGPTNLLALFVWWGLSIALATRPYLIKQRVNSIGELEIYSPYVLWNDGYSTKYSYVTEPFKIYSSKGLLDVTLTVKAVKVTNTIFSYTTRVYCYENICSAPGPTIVCLPGDNLKIKLVNELTDTNGRSAFPSLKEEVFYPNRTNIFIQTLPLDPTINSPFRYTKGNGDSINYVYHLPDDLPPGFHWYYSRVHGVASLHVMGGLFGAIEILQKESYFNPSLYKSLQHVLLVMSHVFAEKDGSYLENIPKRHSFSLVDEENQWESSSLSLTFLSNAFGSKLPLNITYLSDNLVIPDLWLVNNQFQPTITIAPGQWIVFDIVVASGDRILELTVGSETSSSAIESSRCSLKSLGRNGRYYSSGRSSDRIVLLQGDRANIAVMCPSNGTFYLKSVASTQESDPYYTVGDYTTKSIQLLLQLQVTGTYNVNSTTVEKVFDDLSFLSPSYVPDSTDTVLSTSLKSGIYDLLQSYGANQTSDLLGLSLSTAQNPKERRSGEANFDELCRSEISNMSVSLFLDRVRFVLGLGDNCQNPCYDEVLCSALYGNENSTSYSVQQFPLVLNGECSFTATSLLGVGSTTKQCPASSDVLNALQELRKKLQVNQSFSQELPSGSHLIRTNKPLYSMSVYGHATFLYPIFVQNHAVHLSSFEALDSRHRYSNILRRDQYAPNYTSESYRPEFLYGFQTGDTRDTFLAVPGRMNLIAEIQKQDGLPLAGMYPVLSTYLKFSDRGFMRFLAVSNVTTPDNKPIKNENTTTEGNSTVSLDARLHEATYPDSVTVDGTIEPFLCDVSGHSAFYEEKIDPVRRVRILRMNSCPNHFSVCQSEQCGGPGKTRALIRFQEIEVPLYPSIAASPSDTTCIDSDLGSQSTVEGTFASMAASVASPSSLLGVAFNGVGVYGPGITGQRNCIFLRDQSIYGNATSRRGTNGLGIPSWGRTVCLVKSRGEGLLRCGDGVQETSRRVDKCGGLADEFLHDRAHAGIYRYLSLPTCLFQQLTIQRQTVSNATFPNSAVPSNISSMQVGQIAAQIKHSVQLGWARDGFPIYGPTSVRGIVMRPCGRPGAHSQLCLDACNGYQGRLPGVDEYLYRYYMSGNHTASGSLSAPTCSKSIRNGKGNCARLDTPCCAPAVPDTSFYPYTIGCFRGCILDSINVSQEHHSCFLTSKRGTTSDFVPVGQSRRVTFPSANLSSIGSVALFDDAEQQSIYMSTNKTISSSDVGGDSAEIFPHNSTDPQITVLNQDRRVLTRDAHDLSFVVYRVAARDATENITVSDDTISVISQRLGGLQADQLLGQNSSAKRTDAVDEDIDLVAQGTTNLVPSAATGSTPTVLPQSSADEVFSGLALDSRCQMLYYTDQRSIYKLQLDPESGLPLGHVPSPVTVVGGIIQVEIWGRNLGHTFSDVLAITVQSTHVCTSIVHVNASYVTCLVTDAAASPNEPTAAGWLASDITLRTTAGVAYGIALNAESIVASASYRPAITHVRFARHALAPYGLSLVISPSPDKSATDECISGQDVTLYWTNLVAGRHLSALQASQYTSVAAGGSLQRVRGDGIQLETLVGGLYQPRGLLSLSSLLKTEPSSFETFNSSDYEMSYVSSGDENSPLPCKDASRTGYEYLVWQADQQIPSVPWKRSSNSCPERRGHSIFFIASSLDSDSAGWSSLWRIQLLGINSRAVFVHPAFVHHFLHLPPGYLASGSNNERVDSANGGLSSLLCMHDRVAEGKSVSTTLSLARSLLQTNTAGASLQSIAVDNSVPNDDSEANFTSSRLYLTSSAGLVFSIDLRTLLSVKLSSGSNTTTTVNDTSSSWPFTLSTVNLQRYCRDDRNRHRAPFHRLYSFAVDSASATISQGSDIWPQWLRLLRCGDVNTRTHGLSVLSYPYQSAESNASVRFPWSRKQRVITVDTNTQQLIATDEIGSVDSSPFDRETQLQIRGQRDGNSGDLFLRFGVLFPHQILHLDTVYLDEGESARHRFVVSEYLGKMWLFETITTTQNSGLDLSRLSAPMLLLDHSAFTASIVVRDLMRQNARNPGRRSLDYLFFEASP